MDRSSDPSLPKVVISALEYQDLLYFKQKYLELEKANSESEKEKESLNEKQFSSKKHLFSSGSAANSQKTNQIGAGAGDSLTSSNFKRFAQAVAQYLSNENPEVETGKDHLAGLKTSLQEWFSPDDLGIVKKTNYNIFRSKISPTFKQMAHF